MKKILTWALLVGVILPLSFLITACSSDNGANTDQNPPEQPEDGYEDDDETAEDDDEENQTEDSGE